MRDFGCFHDTTVPLKEGYQCLQGPNESGKTTTGMCIRAILYGFSKDSPARKLYTSAYDDYFPLEGREFSAAMELEAGGKRYVVERNFAKENESVRIIDLETREVVPEDESLYTFSGIAQPGAYFWHLSQEDFLRFFAMSDLQSTDAASIFRRIHEMKNFLRTNSSDLDVQRAFDYLDKEKKALGTERAKKSPIGDNQEKLKELEETMAAYRQKSGLLKEQSGEREKLSRTLLDLKRRQKEEKDKTILLPQLAYALKEVEVWDRALDENEKKIERYERKRGKGFSRGIYYKAAGLSALAFLAIGIAFFGKDRMDLAFVSALSAGFFFIVSLILFLLRRLTLRNLKRYHQAFYERDQLLEKKNARFDWFDALVEEDLTMEDLAEAMRRRAAELERVPLDDGLDERIEALQRQLGQMDARDAEKDVLDRDMKRAEEAYAGEQKRERQLQKKREIIEICEELLREVNDQGRIDFQKTILTDGSRYMEELSEGRYDAIILSEEGFVLSGPGGRIIKESQLSRSTADLLVLSLRLAAVEKMDPSIPMLFDDGFVYLDPDRKERLKQVLQKLNRQVIEFTTPKIERRAN